VVNKMVLKQAFSLVLMFTANFLLTKCSIVIIHILSDYLVPILIASLNNQF
jgi:hypothetical protein